MQEKVAAFILKHEDEQEQKETRYREEVISAAGLVSDEIDFVETTFAEYNTWRYNNASMCKAENGKYYVKKRLPLRLTEEEFAAVEKAIPDYKLAEIRARIDGVSTDDEGRSWAETFLYVIAGILWIGGLIISIIGANVSKEVTGYYSTYTKNVFDFQVFISMFASYFISGCFALCAAELFNRLYKIENLLRRK